MNWLRYALVFLAVAVGVAQLVIWMNAAQGTKLGSAAQIIVPAMIAALIEGQQVARQSSTAPRGASAWRFAVLATGISVTLNLALAYSGPSVAPEFAKLAIAPVLSKQFVILLGLYALGYLIANRFFYTLGASNQLSLMKSRDEAE